MNIENIFPNPIGYFNNIEFTDRVLPIANSILDNIEDKHYLEYQNTYNDIKTQNYLKSFTWIEEYIKKISYEFVEKIGFKFTQKPIIQTLFVSKINNTQFHQRHIHGNSVISGVMYLDTIGSYAPLLFEDPRDVRHFNGMLSTRIESHDIIPFHPIKGDIILFESWIPHKVPSIKKKGNRTTLVFNLGYL